MSWPGQLFLSYVSCIYGWVGGAIFSGGQMLN